MSSGEQQQPDGVGRLLAGRYRVLGQLGRGGMGVVWRAVDEVLHREVAVKELRTFTDTGGPELADLRLRMQREARAAARVRHPGVVAVHDVAEVEGRPLIVMELVDGPSLDDVLRERGPLDPREAAAVGGKVMEALAAAHRVGVLHRDVKPGNILLETGGRVVLTDFGIATMEDPGDGSATHLTRSGELVGSLDYLAPERAQGQEPGPASDVWALGATLYAAVEGASPFRRTSTWSTLTAIVVEPLPVPLRAGALMPVLRLLMDKDPQARPDAEGARRLLEQVASGEGVSAVPPGAGAGTGAGAGVATGPVGTVGSVGAVGSVGYAGSPPPGVGDGQREATVRHVPTAPPPGFGPPPASGEAAGFGSPGVASVPPSGSIPAPMTTPAPEPSGRRADRAGRPRKSKALLAAAAVAVVLAATGVTVAALSGGDDKKDQAQDAQEAGSTVDPGADASRGAMDTSDGSKPSKQGDKKKPKDSKDATRPDKAGKDRDGGKGTERDGSSDKGEGSGSSDSSDSSDGPADRPKESSKPPKGGTSGGGSSGDTQEPVCHPAGGGKYNCSVWRTAKSYTASGAEAGTLNAGTNYFFCQQNLGRRETHGEWTNVWWAKTDDDSGNTNVFVSAVYLKGGDNDKPLPGLPVC
ncbi:serine/threonine-protein kinase [Streptomyces aureoverticillatus]|uniref:serine/threonine-protein kinase n=1 Tax=Streptomyces aureoverticillatus TaxID=66871 RepID=UPI0013DD0AFD|nr:serine/threonine-protein kinase [Streptomyces aureoverticillatus]QIB47339.1 serine/threonine protein kinase [Streptomyces aureoverticillatus]